MTFSYPGFCWHHYHKNQLTSTNECIRALKGFGKVDIVLSAREQTKGRGLDKNTWHSEAGKNILMSLAFNPLLEDASRQFEISTAIALGVLDMLKSYLPDRNDLFIKWPNDIYAGDFKICGMLIQHQLIGSSINQTIAGIGLNVNQDVFPDYLPNPVSMKMLCDREFDVDEVLAGITKYISKRLLEQRIDAEGQKAEYLQSLYRREGLWPFMFQGEKINARISGIDQFGQLMLQTESGKLITAAMKEISYLIFSEKSSEGLQSID